jgi:hypothetical protein
MNDNIELNPLEPNWAAVAHGTPVFAADDQRLGAVKDKREDGLLVEGEDGQGTIYLVTGADIGTIGQDGVHLIVAKVEAMRAHWQGTSRRDASAPGGMAPGAMTRENAAPDEQPS